MIGDKGAYLSIGSEIHERAAGLYLLVGDDRYRAGVLPESLPTEESTMKRSKKPIPRFASVDEESAFWDIHSPLDVGAWEVVPYEKVCTELGARTAAKRSVTLRLDRDLVEKLKRAARKHKVKYQALAREILWQSLTRRAQ